MDFDWYLFLVSARDVVTEGAKAACSFALTFASTHKVPSPHKFPSPHKSIIVQHQSHSVDDMKKKKKNRITWFSEVPADSRDRWSAYQSPPGFIFHILKDAWGNQCVTNTNVETNIMSMRKNEIEELCLYITKIVNLPKLTQFHQIMSHLFHMNPC